MCSPEEFIREWLGVSHLYNGRDHQGVDCYGLVWLYYHNVLGRSLPDWNCADSSRIWVARFMEEKVKERLRLIEHPEDHCIVMIQRRNIANHTGIFYKGSILHCLEQCKVVFQPVWIVQSVFGNLRYGVPDELAVSED